MSDDDGIWSGSKEELYLAEKEWKKLNQRSTREGFREGISQASEDSLQAGFDEGYAKSFQTGLVLGKLRGKLSAKKLISGEGEVIEEIVAIEAELSEYEAKCKSMIEVNESELQLKSSEIEAKLQLL